MGARGKNQETDQEQPEQKTQMVEVPINLELLNNKLNYIINQLELMNQKK